VRKPTVFLFDEPLSNLDAKMRVQMRVEIRKLNLAIQTTMIYVTHDQVEAMTLGDRLAVMNKGRIHQVGTPLELYDQPADSFVGSFIGSPAMNFIDGELQGGTIQTPFTEIPVPQRFGGAMDGGGDGRVVVGIRPEDIYIGVAPGEAKRFHRCEARIDVTESLGNEIIFHLQCSGHPVVVRDATERKESPGETVPLHIDLDKIHIFDKTTGKSLLGA
jgi:multiple sugar transport system ATP-binding protein